MSAVPRLLPIVAVAIGGVLVVNGLSGARDLPGLIGGAKAWAEDVGGKAAAAVTPGADAAKTDPALKLAAGPLPPNRAASLPTQAPAAVCAATDAAIAREAGLSPEQMRLLESLQSRRGQLDEREKTLEIQLQLLAAAEKKLDAKIATMNSLKGEVTNLLGQADEKQKAEVARMVGVYTTMAQQKPKEAAKQLTILDDSVRLPIAAGMSNRTLATILANMTPGDAKKLNEALARRYESQRLDQQKKALTDATAAQQPAPAEAKPAPVKTAQAAPPRKAQPKTAPKPKVPDPADAAAPMNTTPEAAPADKAQAG